MLDEPELPPNSWPAIATLAGDDDYTKLYAIAKKHYMKTNKGKLTTAGYRAMVCAFFATAYSIKVANDARAVL